METNKKKIGKINTQRCSVTLNKARWNQVQMGEISHKAPAHFIEFHRALNHL
jgi:hypothetical protein